MGGFTFPFELDDAEQAHGGDPYACTLYKMLPKPMQESTKEDIHLLEYLHMVPVNDVGIPEYFPVLTSKLKDKKKLNLIYPVEGRIYIHIMEDPEGGRAFYIFIEPQLSGGLVEKDLIREVEILLMDYPMEFEGAETPEDQKDVLVRLLDRITQDQPTDESGLRRFLKKLIRNKSEKGLYLSDRDKKVLKYIIIRDKIGMGVLDPMIHDTNIEDISCSGLGPIFIEHKVFDGLRTAFVFTEEEELDTFVLRLSERIKKPVTFRTPVIDAVLPDGSACIIPHIVNRTFPVNAENIEKGWVIDNRLTKLPLPTGEDWDQAQLGLDTRGDAVGDAHAAAISRDGKWLVVSCGGTHELLIFRLPQLPWPAADPGDFIPQELLEGDERFRRLELGGRPCMERLLERSHRSAIGHFNLGCYLALLGQTERAIEEVTLACGLEEKYRQTAASEDDLKSLRGDSGFEQLLP